MGTPASSALRADNATNAAALSGAAGDAYGSLTGLGGPRKFKKKPVLVLDPEELERAHLMFQEASAELLGEEVERAPKPAATMLGLAPMDDEDAAPEDMGQTDDDQDGGDDEAIPSAEDLLHMTSSSRAVEEDEEEQAYAMRALEEGFDEDHRIFPTLPVKPEAEIAAEEAAELAGPEPLETGSHEDAEALPEEPAAPEPEAHEHEAPSFKLSPLSAGESEPEDDEDEQEDSSHFAALAPQIRRETPIRPAEPVEAAEEPAPEPEPEPEPIAELPQVEVDFRDEEPAPLPEEAAPLPGQEVEPETEAEASEPMPRFEHAPEDLPASPHIGPFDFQRASLPAEPEAPAEEAEAPVPGFTANSLPQEPPAPEPHDELPPAEPAPEEPEWVEPPRAFVAEEGPRWQPESYDAPEEPGYEDDYLPEAAMEPEAGFDTHEDHFDDAGEEAGNYTVIEDEPVDGYAFMYADNPRGRALRSVAPGEANSLRARLVREREELQAQAEWEAASTSLVARFWNWLRGLFG